MDLKVSTVFNYILNKPVSNKPENIFNSLLNNTTILKGLTPDNKSYQITLIITLDLNSDFITLPIGESIRDEESDYSILGQIIGSIKGHLVSEKDFKKELLEEYTQEQTTQIINGLNKLEKILTGYYGTKNIDNLLDYTFNNFIHLKH